MQYSKYQLDIFHHVENVDSNLVVSATAGAGKTFTLVESLNRVPKKYKRKLCIAFNKSIADHLKTKVPDGVDVKTFHALGLSVIYSNLKSAKMDDKKVPNKVKDFFTKNNIKIEFKDRIKVSNDINKIVDGLRLELVTNPTREDVVRVMAKYDIDPAMSEEVDWAISIYPLIIEDVNSYDFVDMLFLPIYHEMKFPKYDFIAVDEVQDMSIIQRKLFMECLKKDGKFLGVGDENQSIYQFCGADEDSYQSLCKLDNTIELPLSISYRCGKNIVKYANKLVPSMEFYEKNPDGIVIHDGSLKNVNYGDVILCRTCAPIAKLACKFLREGKKVQIKGADIGRNLITLIKNTGEQDLKSLYSKLEKKLKKVEKEVSNKNDFIDAKKSSKYQVMSEKILTIQILGEDCNSTDEVINKIQTIFSDDDSKVGITLSTIHKFKGLESNNVFIVEPQLIPFPYYLDRVGALQQEQNLEYVAITRAINKLEYITDWTSFDKKSNRKYSKKKEEVSDEYELDSMEKTGTLVVS